MSCTIRRGWARASADAAVLIGTLLQGCSTAEVDPRYDALKPGVICVLPVENQTIHQLERVAFGGLLQRGTMGADEYNIPALVRASLEEALLFAGYTTAPYDGRAPLDGPSPPGLPAPPYDGVLLATIESWWANTMGIPAFGMRYRVELRRVPTGEVLYRHAVDIRQEENPRARSADMVSAAIRRSARQVLSDLPPR